MRSACGYSAFTSTPYVSVIGSATVSLPSGRPRGRLRLPDLGEDAQPVAAEDLLHVRVRVAAADETANDVRQLRHVHEALGDLRLVLVGHRVHPLRRARPAELRVRLEDVRADPHVVDPDEVDRVID